MTRLLIHEEGAHMPPTLIIEGSARNVYYAGMNFARTCRRYGDEVPYMYCTDKKINFLLTCKRMSINFGFAE